MNQFQVPSLLRNVSDQMRASLAQDLVPHKGELGAGREEVIRQFLRNHLPARFGISTGFVFDAQGLASDQIDIVIYDKLTCPIFEAAGGRKFFPCECVVAVGEVKSRISSGRDLESAFDNVKSVKKLDRSAAGVNRALGTDRGINQHTEHLDQIFGFVFVIDRCLTSKTLRAQWFYYLREAPRHLWPNVVFHFDHFLMTYACSSGVCANPQDARAITVVERNDASWLLLRFYGMLARAVDATNVSEFSYWEYLNGDEPLDADAYWFGGMPYNVHVPPHMLNVPGDRDYQQPAKK
jgi:hypothetical protein